MKYFNIKRYKFSTITKNLSRLSFSFLNFLKLINFKKIYNYFDDIKRYKFSTIAKNLSRLSFSFLYFFKLVNFKKIYNYFDDTKYVLKKTFKHLNSRKVNIVSTIKNIKVKSNKFLFYHLPFSLIFFGLLYIIIPTFYTYNKTIIQKVICKNNNVECIIKGKITYSFFPTPRLKVKNLMINIPSNNKEALLTTNDVTLKLSIKNLLAKDKHEIKKIFLSNFESNINLRRLKNYNTIFKSKISSVPIVFTKGKIILHEEKNYVATISDVKLITKFLKNSSKTRLDGKFLNDNITINFSNKISDNKPKTNIEFKMKDINFYTKVNFFNSYKNINNGKFLIKLDKNKISGIFDYKNNEITILKSNTRNSFIDGKLIGKIIFLPYFDFDLDLDLNSINFTRLYNYFLFLNAEEQKKLFKINNKVNGKLNFSAEKVYSKHNLVKSFESRIKFYNGNIKIEQFLINLGKLGAADLLGGIDNDKQSTNFKFESNIFLDNKKKFLNKFGIYNKENLPSSLFIQGNFDLENIRANFYEILGKEKFNTEDVNFIESEFNDLMLENGFKNLFNFQKFKVFLKSARDEKN